MKNGRCMSVAACLLAAGMAIPASGTTLPVLDDVTMGNSFSLHFLLQNTNSPAHDRIVFEFVSQTGQTGAQANWLSFPSGGGPGGGSVVTNSSTFADGTPNPNFFGRYSFDLSFHGQLLPYSLNPFVPGDDVSFNFLRYNNGELVDAHQWRNFGPLDDAVSLGAFTPVGQQIPLFHWGWFEAETVVIPLPTGAGLCAVGLGLIAVRRRR